MSIFQHWELLFRCYIMKQMDFDAAHDIEHIKRVVKSARTMADEEGADLHIVLPAAWLHDCVNVDKESPERNMGSKLSADAAIEFLKKISYPSEYYDAIHHAIHSHSFSANIEPTTVEAMVVQDADRIDALGALGLARCLAYSAKKDRTLYDHEDPFAENRDLDESSFAIDHFYTKLLKLHETMNTDSGKKLAAKRTEFLHSFIDSLKEEIA